MEPKQLANWIHEQVIGDANSPEGKLYISDKGAVKITKFNANAQEQFVTCLMPNALAILANVDFAGLLASPEYVAVLEQKQVNKAQVYMNQRIEQEKAKAAKKITAALDALRALGVDPSTLKVG